jgi:aconitate hydratase
MAATPERSTDPFGAKATIETSQGQVGLYRLSELANRGSADLDALPMTVKILLESLLRVAGTQFASEDDVETLAAWDKSGSSDREIPYSPSRVILQDFTGVPAVVDLAAMRSAMDRAGSEPAKVDPLVPVDLVVDHSVQVDAFGMANAYEINVKREYERNHERYSLLKWAQGTFRDFRVVPPGMGIVHQVNLEYLAKVVRTVEDDQGPLAIPDTLVGTDSHTTMINGLGVLGWGVGGIEAEAAMLGQPMPLATPTVLGFRTVGALQPGVTATDLVLTITEILRKHGVVGKFVEFYGAGLSNLTVADRATISNMCPEYGATAALFPVDDQSLKYLRLTGRKADLVDLVERYTKEQQMFRTDDTPDPTFSEVLELDLGDVEPSVAGPRRPQDRVPLSNMWKSFTAVYEEHMNDGNGQIPIRAADMIEEGAPANVPIADDDPTIEDQKARTESYGQDFHIENGSIVIAAITSCTNTSNPQVMLGAGLLAKKAVERGLISKPWVKTSTAPGSRVVSKYLEGANLVPYLEKLGFHVVGFGCTTCIGNSGPLPAPIARAIEEHDLAVVSVLSGNRNFEGRIHPLVKASYLGSPPLVVAYALAGTANIDLSNDPLGRDESGNDVYLRDLWPSTDEIEDLMSAVKSELFNEEYGKVFDGDDNWTKLSAPKGKLYKWDPDSTYVREPPFFQELSQEPEEPEDITGARVLVKVGDSVTTDHISPAGAFPPSSPAGKHLQEKGVEPQDFNSYGSRRGNHEVMVRGTFANIRLRNELASREGGWTTHLPDGDEMTIFEASMKYQEEGIPLVVLAGKEYGSGSSRDWAAKGPRLLGVRAAIAESFERIHRSNLVGMGVLPLQFKDGENAESLGLTGKETYDIKGIADGPAPGTELTVTATPDDGDEIEFKVLNRIDSEVELDYYRNGGVLQMVLRRMLSE